jgi:hypothetical protein
LTSGAFIGFDNILKQENTMSRGVKIALIVIVGLLACCCIGGAGIFLYFQQAFSQVFITDPAQTAKIGHSIAEYEVPPGYTEIFANSADGYKVVAIGPRTQGSGGMLLLIMEFPIALQEDEKEMERQINSTFEQQNPNGKTQLLAIGKQETIIRGQSVTLKVSEGNDSAGTQRRQVMGTFASKNSTAAFLGWAAKADWDETLITRFLASIR